MRRLAGWLWAGLRLGAVSGRTGARGGECARGGFCGIGPALARNVGAGRAFALCARGCQDVDVPTLPPARSRGGWVPSAVERGLGVMSVRARVPWAGPLPPGQGAAGPDSHPLRTRDARHPGSPPLAHLPAGFGGSRPRMSCCLRYHSRRVRESMESLKSLKLAMLRAPSMSSFRVLLRSPLASVDQPR